MNHEVMLSLKKKSISLYKHIQITFFYKRWKNLFHKIDTFAFNAAVENNEV